MDRQRQLSVLALLLIATAFPLSGCGGSDAPSREEFAKNAEGVCADVEKEMKSIGKIDPDTPAEVSSLLSQIKARVDDGIDRLSALDRPDGDDGMTAEEFVNALNTEFREQAIPALDELDQAVKQRDKVKLRAAARKLDALENTQSDRLAKELGATKCAE